MFASGVGWVEGDASVEWLGAERFVAARSTRSSWVACQPLLKKELRASMARPTLAAVMSPAVDVAGRRESWGKGAGASVLWADAAVLWPGAVSVLGSGVVGGAS